MAAKKKIDEMTPISELPTRKEVGEFKTEITLHKDLKFCYVEKASEIRDAGAKAGKLDCKVNLKMIVNAGVDHRDQEDMFRRVVGNYFPNGMTITMEVK